MKLAQYILFGLLVCNILGTVEVRASAGEDATSAPTHPKHQEIVISTPPSSHQAPGVAPGFSKFFDPNDRRSLFEILNKSLFEVLGHDLLLTNVLPRLDLRSLKAVLYTSKEGLAIVLRLKQIVEQKVGMGFVNCSANHLTASQYRVANTLRMPVHLWTFIGDGEGKILDGESPGRELVQPLTSIIAQLGSWRLSAAELKDPVLSEDIPKFPHIYRLTEGLLQKAVTIEGLGIQFITEPPILFQVPVMLTQFKGLTSLTLRDAAVLRFPPEFAELTNLTHLYLINNGLEELPSVLLKLGNLQKFNLSDNKLETLPNNMRGLASLCILYLDGNPLTQLPPGILTLHKLEYLSLGNTSVCYLPLALCSMPKLETIAIYDGKQDIWKPDRPKTRWEATKRFFSMVFVPFIIIPQAWNDDRGLISTNRDVLRDSVSSISGGLMIRGLVVGLLPIILPIGLWNFKPPPEGKE